MLVGVHPEKSQDGRKPDVVVVLVRAPLVQQVLDGGLVDRRQAVKERRHQLILAGRRAQRCEQLHHQASVPLAGLVVNAGEPRDRQLDSVSVNTAQSFVFQDSKRRKKKRPGDVFAHPLRNNVLGFLR